MNKLIKAARLMKMVKRFAWMVMTVFLLSVMTGCGATSEQWAYNHEPENKILELFSNGKAEYKGNGYTYTKDDSFIHLKDKSGNTTDIRYVMEGDEMLFYEASAYHREGGSAEDGVYGLWKQNEGKEFFQFNKDGKFSEDNIFFGKYGLDKDAGTIKLMYSDPLQDTILYYTLDGDTITIEYPWRLVRIKTGTDK